jgi:hypothetical protein
LRVASERGEEEVVRAEHAPEASHLWHAGTCRDHRGEYRIDGEGVLVADDLAGAAEAVMTVAAMRDLARRPADKVRGPKAAWVLASFIQPVGPVVYFAAGRR